MSSSDSLNSSFFASISFAWAGEAVVGENRNRWFCWSRLKSFYIADETPNVDISQSLGKQARPERFNIDPICFNKGIDPILSDYHLIVQDKGWVEARESGYRGDDVDGLHGVMEALIPKQPWLPWKTQIHWLKKKLYSLF